MCCPLLVESQHCAAVANGSRLCAKGTRTCPEFGHHSIQMQPPSLLPTRIFYDNATEFCPEFARITCQCNPLFSPNATQTARIPFKCNLILCKIRPNYNQMQPKPSEFHSNIGGGTAHKERACVEVVHTFKGACVE